MNGLLAGTGCLLKPTRRRMHFTLHSLFVALTTFGISLHASVSPARRQCEAVAAVEALDGQVNYAQKHSLTANLFRPFLPRNYVDYVVSVRLGAAQNAEHGSACLHGRNEMRQPRLAIDLDRYLEGYLDNRQVAYLSKLAGLTRLQELCLIHVPVTDDGLAVLKNMRELRVLSLAETYVSDAGLVHLAELKGLEQLHLDDTQVTDAGLIHLRLLNRLQRLSLRGTYVSDRGLREISTLKGLRYLRLDGTLVTEESVAQLRKSLPKCVISARRLGRR